MGDIRTGISAEVLFGKVRNSLYVKGSLVPFLFYDKMFHLIAIILKILIYILDRREWW